MKIDIKDISTEFKTTVEEFINDIDNCMPEYHNIIMKWWNFEGVEDRHIVFLYNYYHKLFPNIMPDIICKNDEIFEMNSNVNTAFLPGICFKSIWSDSNTTDSIKASIWNYLQVLSLSIINTTRTNSSDTDASNNFNITEAQISQLQDLLLNMDTYTDNSNSTNDNKNDNKNTPDINTNDALNSIFNNKLFGSIARELTTDLMDDLTKKNEDDDDMHTTEDMMKNMMTNPAKLLGLVQTTMSKFDKKIKSENISQQDIMTESMEMLSSASGVTNSSGSDISAMMKGVMGMMTPMLSRQQSQSQSDCFSPNSQVYTQSPEDKLLNDAYENTFPETPTKPSNSKTDKKKIKKRGKK